MVCFIEEFRINDMVRFESLIRSNVIFSGKHALFPVL